ncbi:MAG: choice-of-anchor D domain-containing protein [Candidatus Kapabacteria bacterium]|nr:choice-of-anchor D domain-containing protein [Ignavibacteriota bacterium]MCW5883570.1 choice-of-anchor D domain-containing protein [Candidatus Kapabacteria bacterium]
MHKVGLLILFLILSSSLLNAQRFNVSEVNSENYPSVSVNFSAFNAQGQYYTNLSKTDFKVFDNGFEIPLELYELTCTNNSPVNAVLVLDRSTSMTEKYEGETLWQWVLEGATSFIDNFAFGDSSTIAITAFSGVSILVCDFTNNKKELIDSLYALPNPYGSTNFNGPFFDEKAGALNLLKTRPAHHRRAIVFLSDGEHELGVQLRREEILKNLNELNIRFYGITLMYENSPDLPYWSLNTAGKSVFVNSKSALNNIYKTFASDLQMTVQCNLSWISPEICDISETFRKAEIWFLVHDDRVTREYTAPEEAIVYIDKSEEIYNFGDPPIGQTSQRDVIITPRVRSLRVLNIEVSPAEYFEIVDYGQGPGNVPAYPFLIPEGIARTIKIRYTPQNERKYRQATLMINGEPCPIEIPLHGGYQQINVDTPVDAEIISRCDTVEISWSGVPANVQVDLYYSTDGGNRWNVIREKATGNKYSWFTNFTSDKILVKAKVSDQFGYDFIRSYGGAGDEFVTSVAVQSNGLYYIASGYFKGSLNIAGKNFNESGLEDFFVAKFDLDGNPVWVNVAGARQSNDRANGLALDRRGFIYVTGFAYSGIRFGNIAPSLEMPDKKYMFLAKYSPTGQYLNSTFVGASTFFNIFEAEGSRIKVVQILGQQTKIVVIGKYKGTFTNLQLNKTLPDSDGAELPFTAVFDENLNMIDLIAGVPDNNNFSDLISNHIPSGTIYTAGNFSGNTNVQGQQLSSSGLSDFWFTKYARNPISQDITEEFEVLRPTAAFSTMEYNFGPVVFGDETEQLVDGLITNVGKLPYTITRYTIRDAQNANMVDFRVIDEIVGMTLNPGESIDITLWFKPGGLNERRAVLTLYGDCADNITLSLVGNGVCGGTALEEYDFGDVNLNKQKMDTLICVFQNISESPTIISPQIRGLHITDFLRILPDYVKAKEVNGRITVGSGECIDIIVIFEPKSLGLREAELNFFVQAPCKNSITKLYGTGITSDVGITSHDWGQQRIRGNYTAQVEIINNSNVAEMIENIQFENGNIGNIFGFTSPGNFPLLIPANGEIKMNVSFRPQEEIDYSEQILVFLGSREEPIVSYLTGTGFLPKLTTSVSCGEQVNVGETALGSITINNPSSSSVLTVESITIENDDEFEFLPGTVTSNLTIDKEGSLTIPVIFKPISGGDNTDNFIILADDYDGSFMDEWNTTIVPIVCDGLDAEITNPLDFGNLLVCTERSLPITILNKSRDTDLIIRLSEMVITGSGSNEFELPSLGDRTLKGGESFTFDVNFKPQNKGNFDVELIVPNSMSAPFKVPISGKSLGIELESAVKEITMTIGEKFRYSLMAKLPQTYSGFINNIKITFSADPSVLGIMQNSIRKGAQIGNEFSWSDIVSLGNGYFEVTGSGALRDNQILEIMNFEIQTYLNDKHRTLLAAEIDYGCTTDLYELTIFNTNEVCLNDNRIIQMSGHKFGMTVPKPNPAGDSFEFTYTVAFDVETDIAIINAYGEVIRTISRGEAKAGVYTLSVPTNEINSGAYMIKMVSGPFIEAQSLMIVK